MKLRIALIVCTLTVLFAAVPAFADDASANAKKEQEIQKLLVDKLGKDAEAIRVTIVGDKTTLTGQVTNRGTQELADEVLMYAGVTKKKIDNQIKAKDEKGLFSGKTKKEMADYKIEKAVRSKVKGEIGDSAKAIQIECTGDTCSMRGTLPDQGRKDLAMKAAAGVEGVKHIVDLVHLKG